MDIYFAFIPIINIADNQKCFIANRYIICLLNMINNGTFALKSSNDGVVFCMEEVLGLQVTRQCGNIQNVSYF